MHAQKLLTKVLKGLIAHNGQDDKGKNVKFEIQKLFLVLLLWCLTSCTDAVCIDADDFGFSHVKVTATYPPDKIHGTGDTQYAEWYDSGLTLSGGPIHVIVKQWDLLYNINSSVELSAWCPWLGPADNPPSLTDISMMLDICDFQNNDSCCDAADAPITNAPCLLKRGMGLYMLVAPRGFDPNESGLSMQDPVSVNSKVIVKHLGSKTDSTKFYDMQIRPDNIGGSSYLPTGGADIKLTTQQRMDMLGGKLYFKVLDKHYDDNNGQYIVTVKSGVTTSEWDPTEFTVDLVKNFFFGSAVNPHSVSTFYEPGVIKQMFNNVINDPGYRLSVSAMLTLSILFYAINFLIGNIKMTHSDLVIRVVKILIVSQLISNNSSWDFFYNNFFTYFIDGSQYLIQIVKDTGGAGPGASSLISLMLSPHVFIKLAALPFVSWEAFAFSLIYVVVYIIVLSLVFVGLFYASVVYTTCIVMMGLIVSLAPIFLCFLLFEPTKHLFEKWLKQLMSFALQPLVVVTGVTLASLMIRHQIYQTLGFTACKQDIFDIDHHENSFKTSIRGSDSRSAGAYYWKPVYSTSEPMTEILIPEAHFEDGNGNQVSASNSGAIYCEPYMCKGQRYLSFPFLNPKDPSDKRALSLFMNGNFSSLLNILFLLISSALIAYFVIGATKIAQYITGSAVDITGSTIKSTKTIGKAWIKTAKVAAKTAIKVGLIVATGGKSLGKNKSVSSKKMSMKKSDYKEPQKSDTKQENPGDPFAMKPPVPANAPATTPPAVETSRAPERPEPRQMEENSMQAQRSQPDSSVPTQPAAPSRNVAKNLAGYKKTGAGKIVRPRGGRTPPRGEG